MKVLSVASECAPFVKTGGLADVVGALPKALGQHDVAMRTLLPAYPALAQQLTQATEVRAWDDLFGGSARVLLAPTDIGELLLLDAPHLYDRPGEIYLDATKQDWHDNHLRYAALGWVAAQLAVDGIDDWYPDICHAHDWQAGLVPVYLRQRVSERAVASVLTVHNIAFQGLFDAAYLPQLKLGQELFHPAGVEFFDQIGFLKAGLQFANRITTVSPTYARELMLPEFGLGLEGMLQYRVADFSGILNGIDLDVWNPASDPNLVANYSIDSIDNKTANRHALEKRFELASDPEHPLFCVVSRLTEQKGLDLLLECLPALVERGARLAVLGSGDAVLERGFMSAMQKYRGRVGTVIGYDEPLSHLMQGGSDAIIIPSRFEPCGLTQLYGLRYGTLPVVAQTGGLADTVIDANFAAVQAGSATGVVFTPVTFEALNDALEKTCELFAQTDLWRQLISNAMSHPVGWNHSAALYKSLYQMTLT